ncbi:hypothetical protein LUZ16_28710 [Streptomyces albireticuli]|uniref:MAB_1171c family putative transporter n=1 Tax=Streptomyces albireticuli TaxID=1940 RepID=UPI001E351F60|nr:MAB_1171c family putative transporter [Streptomyces albireticuli]MCD9145987.1 hypothetical protein [Streptomyces albireticuli]
MDLKRMRRLCAELLSGLDLPGPARPDVLFTALCAGMSRRHDRPVSHRLVSFPAGTVSGLWVATDAQHLVLCEKDTAPVHQLVILGHDLWHLEEHHRADPALSTAEAAPCSPPARPTPRYDGSRHARPSATTTKPRRRRSAHSWAAGPANGSLRKPTTASARHRSQDSSSASKPPWDPRTSRGPCVPDPVYYLPSIVVGTALCLKLRDLARAPQDTLLRVVCAVLFFSCGTFAFAAPTSIAFVNRLTGVPNIAAPLVYSLLSALAASWLILIDRWRGGPAPQRERAARRWAAGYGLVIVALCALFALGNAPEERRVDLDTYYANTPFIREMIVLYLLATGVAAISISTVCGSWARHATGRPWLQRGLRVLTAGFLCNLGFDLTKLAAVAARWTGTDWDNLSTLAAPRFGAMGTLCIATGFLLPPLGHHLTAAGDTFAALRTQPALHCLWATLSTATPGVVANVPVPWWAVDLRLTRRIAEIHDGRLALRPYFEATVADAALERAHRTGRTGREAEAIAEAAVLAVAAQKKSAGLPTPALPLDQQPRSTTAEPPLPLTALVRVSRALRHSPIVATARRHLQEQETTTHAPAEQDH